MTEISSLRLSGKTRTLGDVKDDASYLKVAQRTESGDTISPRGINGTSVQSSTMRDVPDSIQQAALIDIVASVNGEGVNPDGFPEVDHAYTSTTPVDVRENYGNAVNVLSNLVLTKDRTISIPKPQTFEDPPEKFSTKKPVFYKHSTDEVNNAEAEAENRKRVVSLTRTRTNINEEKDVKKTRPKSESIQISVSLHQLNQEEEKSSDAYKDWFASPAKVRIARSMTPRRRRLTSINRKNESRTLTTLSTCEAVDIMDTTESLQNRLRAPGSSPSRDLGRERVELLTEDLNLYRAKSLPALFPVKRKKEVTQLNLMNKSKLISPFKPTSVRAYGGFPNGLLGKTIIQKSDESTTFNVTNAAVSQSTQDKFLSDQETDEDPKSEKGTSEGVKDHIITLEGRSIPNPNIRLLGMTPDRDHDKIVNPFSNDLTKTQRQFPSNKEKELWRDLDRHFDELQKKISVKVMQSENKPKTSADSNTDISGYGLVGKGFKSNISSAKSKGDRQSKRVTFAESPGEEEEEERHLTENDADGTIWGNSSNKMNSTETINVPLRKPVIAFNPKTNNKGMSSELVKLKKRIIPASQNNVPKSRYDLLDNVKISKLNNERRERHAPRAPSRVSVFSDSSSFFDDASMHGKETDFTDRGCSSKAKSYGMSSFYPDPVTQKFHINGYPIDSDSDSDSDVDERFVRPDISSMNARYRVLKAVDLGTLSGYQHRKFKKPATAPETTTTHFVKIRLK
ncbi:hypothetical protein FSP39_017812 [Pinctada imbricata]|uniref:Uncharacterized protein n=1 Tax=Pinctada imbricata TaxID=66713 RepID=A0AA88Y823_PINIB|nr:hypothetical protein FSP39_017812 [Pinctada imbricata]